MSGYLDIDRVENEDTLESMFSETDDLDLKRRIRRRQRDIREKRFAEYEAQRQIRFQQQQRDEDAVTARLRRAEEDKQRKMREFEEQSRLRREAVGTADDALRQRHAAAEEEKQKKLDNFRRMGQIMSTAYNTGVNDLLRDRHKPGIEHDANRANVMAHDSRPSSKAVTGFGGTSYGPKTASTSRQESLNQNAIARNPNTIKQKLLDWSKAQVDGYPNVNVTNFSASWNDGLAFCALIHRFYPNAFDFNQLNPKNRRGNFTLAFNMAQQLADIDPLLDVDDMVSMKNPDWKSVFTYVQSFYRQFATQRQ